MTFLAPSLLSVDFYNIENGLKPLIDENIKYLHLDIMDGNFVPNISFGALLIEKIRKKTNFHFNVHAMIMNPDLFIPDIVKAGGDTIIFHYEASKHPHRTIQLIKSLGKKAGIALNPSTPISVLEYIIDDLDHILIMSVNPGFGGQKFIPQIMNKITETKKMINKFNKNIVLEIDGGINLTNVEDIILRGADIIVSGSDLFGVNDIAQRIKDYRNIFNKIDSRM